MADGSLAGPAFHLQAAMCFYRALRVYPSPVELIVIYQKTVPEDVFKVRIECVSMHNIVLMTFPDYHGHDEPGREFTFFVCWQGRPAASRRRGDRDQPRQRESAFRGILAGVGQAHRPRELDCEVSLSSYVALCSHLGVCSFNLSSTPSQRVLINAFFVPFLYDAGLYR